MMMNKKRPSAKGLIKNGTIELSKIASSHYTTEDAMDAIWNEDREDYECPECGPFSILDADAIERYDFEQEAWAVYVICPACGAEIFAGYDPGTEEEEDYGDYADWCVEQYKDDLRERVSDLNAYCARYNKQFR